MRGIIFDLEDSDFIYTVNDNTGFDSEGNMMMRMGDNMVMDMGDGDIHIVTGWYDEEKKD